MRESFAESLDGSSVRAFDETALAPVRRLNTHALDLLSECSRHPAWSGSDWESALGRRFLKMPAELRAVLTRSPVSLLEFGAVFPDLGVSEPLDDKADPAPPFLPSDKAIELAHIMLTLAWTLSRQDTAAAAIVFGLGAAEAQWIQGFDVGDLPLVSKRISGGLRPRWLDRPRIWRELLRHPNGAQPHVPPPFLRIVQRQLGEVRPATGVSRSTRSIGP